MENWFTQNTPEQRIKSPLQGQIDADVCVIGAGFAGLWTAYEIALRGWSVVILEQARTASGASGCNAGFVAAGFAAPAKNLIERIGVAKSAQLYRLSLEGCEMVQAISETSHPQGKLTLWRTPDTLEHSAHTVMMAGLGVEVEPLSKHQLQQIIQSETYHLGLIEKNAFVIDPYKTAHILAEKLTQCGGKIYEHSPVKDIDTEGVRKIVQTPKGKVRAQHVVICGSAYKGDLLKNVRHAILPVSTSIGITEKLGEKLKSAVEFQGGLLDTRRYGNYFRIIDEDRLLWGGRFDIGEKAPTHIAETMIKEIEGIFPQLAPVFLARTWSGTMGYSVHMMPHIGSVSPNIWGASAFGGHGLNTSAIAGRLIARAIIDKDEEWMRFLPFGLVWTGGRLGRTIAHISIKTQQWLENRAERKKR